MTADDLHDPSGSPLIRWAGLAAMVGGAAWTSKAIAIILTGDQPPIAFEMGPPLFAVGILGLLRRLPGDGRRYVKHAGLAAYLSIALWMVSLPFFAFSPAAATEDSFGVVNALILLTFLAGIVGLILLGSAMRRTRGLPSTWRVLPFSLGLAYIPLMMAGGALSVIDDRLSEIPILVIGAVWVWLGYLGAYGRLPDQGVPDGTEQLDSLEHRSWA